jgi:hypothetical protein
MSPEREALLRTTLAMTVDQRVEWLEQMIAVALESGALPKRAPDQDRTRRDPPVRPAARP